jgi:hypothetical protein
LRRIDLFARVKHGLHRPKDAILRLRMKLLLTIFGINLFKYTELNYLEYGNSATRVVQLKRNIVRDEIAFSDLKSLANFNHAFSDRFTLTIENVIVNTEKSLVYNDRRKLISESSEWPPEQILAFSQKPPGRIAIQIDAGRLGLANSGFYHWLTEDLPAFLSVGSDFPVLEFEKSNTRNTEVYKHLGLTTIRVPDWISVKSLSLSTRGRDLGYLHPANLSILKTFSGSIIQPSTRTKRKIYVSRSRSRRSIPNEILVENYLKSVGYEILFSEDHTFLDQIKIFSQAKDIIAPHGAGLTNAIWSNNARVLEICGTEELNRCFEWQSKVCGHDYTRFEYGRLTVDRLLNFIDSWQP